MCSVVVVKYYPFSYELLYISVQIRLYLIPFWNLTASTHLSVLPLGIVVTRSSFKASLGIALVSTLGCSPNSISLFSRTFLHGEPKVKFFLYIQLISLVLVRPKDCCMSPCRIDHILTAVLTVRFYPFRLHLQPTSLD